MERLPIVVQSDSVCNENDDIVNIVLQNKKDIEDLKAEVVRLKSVIVNMFNSSTHSPLLSAPLSETESEMVIDYPEEHTKKPETVNLRDLEKQAIIAALERNGGKRSAAAKELGFSERTLYRKMIDYDLNKKK